MALEIREIADDDINEIVALWREAGITRPWNDPYHDIAFARLGPHSTVLLATFDGSVAASAMVGEDGHRGWVYYVAVARAHRKTGLGRTIMEAAESWLRARNIWKLQLLVRADNLDAVNFYAKLDYKDTQSVCLQKILSVPDSTSCLDRPASL